MCKFTIIILSVIILLAFYMPIKSQNFDIELLQKLNSESPKELRNYSVFISGTANVVAISTPLAIGITGFIQKNDQLKKDALYIGTSIGFESILTFGMKKSFHRDRPYITYPDLISPYENLSSYSFPSGHTSMAFANATALSLKYPKWYVIVPSYFWACSVGYSRMNLGVHYPSDVLGGAIVGIGSAFISYKLNEWWWKKQKEPKPIDFFPDASLIQK
jgi:membrane-associated phospholipid phosphatase